MLLNQLQFLVVVCYATISIISFLLLSRYVQNESINKDNGLEVPSRLGESKVEKEINSLVDVENVIVIDDNNDTGAFSNCSSANTGWNDRYIPTTLVVQSGSAGSRKFLQGSTVISCHYLEFKAPYDENFHYVA